jgi:triacylglycerol lipase
MSLGFIAPAGRPAETITPPGLRLQTTVALASPRRLWLRGRLLGYAPKASTRSPWWNRWPRREEPVPLARLETHVAGHQLQAAITVGRHGDWDATFDVSLPPSRRGWRIARTHLTFQSQSADACSVVLAPGPGVPGVTVVLLPPDATLAAQISSAPPFAFLADHRAAPILRSLRAHANRQFLCYLACVPPENEETQAGLALALNAAGWPHGQLLLLPAAADEADGVLAQALDRLRWLVAGSHHVDCLNLDTSDRPVLAALHQNEDRAPVRILEVSDAAGAAEDRWLHRRRVRPLHSGLVTRHPLVFCHGMLACSMLRLQLRDDYNYFSVMREYLEDRGFRVLFPRVLPTGGVATRARMLAEQIRRWTHEPVNLIAHSMGGLDARYLISHLGFAEQVPSLTTISTPHRGTYMADWFRANFGRRVPLLGALRTLGISVEGFNDCRPSVCRDFNARTPDDPRVRYFSYAGNVPLHKVTPMLRRAWELLEAEEGPNDGLVSVQSARWGEFLGTVYADHFAQTPDGLFIHPGEDFDSLTFFQRLGEDLARRGF